jgi:hypothetical protein
VLGSNQRRLSRRFYRPLSPCVSQEGRWPAQIRREAQCWTAHSRASGPMGSSCGPRTGTRLAADGIPGAVTLTAPSPVMSHPWSSPHQGIPQRAGCSRLQPASLGKGATRRGDAQGSGPLLSARQTLMGRRGLRCPRGSAVGGAGPPSALLLLPSGQVVSDHVTLLKLAPATLAPAGSRRRPRLTQRPQHQPVPWMTTSQDMT